MRARNVATVPLMVVLLLGCIALVWGGAALAHEMNPATQAQRLEDARHQAELNKIAEQAAARDIGRWDTVKTATALTATLAVPVGSALGILLIVWVAAIYGLRHLHKMRLEHMDRTLYAYPNAQGHLGIPHHLMVMGAGLEHAASAIELAGHARIEAAANHAAAVDWNQLGAGLANGGKLNLRLQGGNRSNRAATPRPVVPPKDGDVAKLPFPDAERLLTLADLGREPERWTVPFGVEQEGGTPMWLPFLETHMLIGGTTGAGKTNLVQGMLKHLTDNYTPRDIRLLLVDPKRTGLHPFMKSPLTEDYAEDAGGWLTVLDRAEEMRDVRQQVLVANGQSEWHPDLRDPKDNPLPLVIVVVDELADVVHQQEAYARLVGLAAKGRSAGVLVWAATQHPRAEIVRPELKANMNRRACGYVPEMAASLVVLGKADAARLPRDGHMFVVNHGYPYPVVKTAHAGLLPLPGDKKNGRPPLRVINPAEPPPPPTQAATNEWEARLLMALEQGDMSRTDIYREFKNRVEVEEVDRMVASLEKRGLVVAYVRSGTGGRPAQMVRLAVPPTHTGQVVPPDPDDD